MPEGSSNRTCVKGTPVAPGARAGVVVSGSTVVTTDEGVARGGRDTDGSLDAEAVPTSGIG